MPFSAPLPQSDRKQHLSVVAVTHRHSTCSRTWKHAWMPSSFDLYSIANAVVTTTIRLPFDSRSPAFQTADESYSFIHLFICSEWQVQIRHCVTQCEPDSKAQKRTLTAALFTYLLSFWLSAQVKRYVSLHHMSDVSEPNILTKLHRG